MPYRKQRQWVFYSFYYTISYCIVKFTDILIFMPSRIKHAIPQVDTTIGETLARIRKDLGLTQVELAEKVGISQQQLSKL